jgi:hypothetical protein
MNNLQKAEELKDWISELKIKRKVTGLVKNERDYRYYSANVDKLIEKQANGEDDKKDFVERIYLSNELCFYRVSQQAKINLEGLGCGEGKSEFSYGCGELKTDWRPIEKAYCPKCQKAKEIYEGILK